MSSAGNSRHHSLRIRLAWAREQERLHGTRLREDPVVARLLAELRSCVSDSRQSMIDADLVEACRTCEEEEGGSCCGSGMEHHYDGVMLLVNLLLGVEIERDPIDEKSCPFLGPTGCRLSARDHVCVNYLCPKVRDRISPSAVAEMRRTQGRELHTLFMLCDHLTRLLGGHPAATSVEPHQE